MNACCTNAGAESYPLRRRLSVTRGDVLSLSFYISFGGSPGIMTEDSEAFFAVSSGDEVILLKRFNRSAQDGDGYIVLSLLPRDTEELEPGCYDYEAEFRFSPDCVVTAMKGTLEVSGDMITREVRRSLDN